MWIRSLLYGKSENFRLCSAPVGIAFRDGDVAVDGKVSEALDESAGLGPFNFEPVELFVFGEAENDARVVR